MPLSCLGATYPNLWRSYLWGGLKHQYHLIEISGSIGISRVSRRDISSNAKIPLTKYGELIVYIYFDLPSKHKNIAFPCSKYYPELLRRHLHVHTGERLRHKDVQYTCIFIEGNIQNKQKTKIF